MTLLVDKCVKSVAGILLLGIDQRAWIKACLSASSSTTNVIWTMDSPAIILMPLREQTRDYGRPKHGPAASYICLDSIESDF